MMLHLFEKLAQSAVIRNYWELSTFENLLFI